MTLDLESHFTRTSGGTYMERSGLAGVAARSQRKVCFVATDKPFLVQLLHSLSLREDCCYVKYSIVPRDGMYLGRCFFTSDAAAARLCAQYKPHPKLLVTLQDDAFFREYRPLVGQPAETSTPEAG